MAVATVMVQGVLVEIDCVGVVSVSSNAGFAVVVAGGFWTGVLVQLEDGFCVVGMRGGTFWEVLV